MNYLKKKQLFLMKNKQFRGYMKTASGYPLTLSDCMEKGLINLTIYGNSVQDGTPSPENSIDVQSVGDKTKNLFTCDLDTISNNKIYYDKSTQIFNLMLGGQQISQSIYTLPSAIPKGTQLTITVYFISGNISGAMSIGGYHKVDGETSSWQCSVSFPKDIDLSGQAVSKTVVTTDTLTDFWIFCNAGSTVNTETKFKVQIEYGEGASEYEPYGYKIPVKINDEDTVNIYLDEPLRKCGEFVDYVDYQNKKIVRQIGKYYITKDTKFTIYLPTSKGLYKYGFNPIPRMYTGSAQPGFGNFLPNLQKSYNTWDTETLHMGTNNYQVYILLYGEYSNDTEIYNYLSNNGTNDIYVIYILAEPIEEDINIEKIQIKKGTNIISAETVLEPSNIEAQYYSSEEE